MKTHTTEEAHNPEIVRDEVWMPWIESIDEVVVGANLPPAPPYEPEPELTLDDVTIRSDPDAL